MENGRDGGNKGTGHDGKIFHLNWKTGSGRNQTQVHSIRGTRSLQIQNRKHSPRVYTCLQAWLSERTQTGKIAILCVCVCVSISILLTLFVQKFPCQWCFTRISFLILVSFHFLVALLLVLLSLSPPPLLLLLLLLLLLMLFKIDGIKTTLVW